MKRYISLSGGVESTTLSILYGKGATAIWCDPGAEHIEMHDRMDNLEIKLKELHNGDFELVRIKPSVFAKGEIRTTIIEYALAYNFLPSKRERWCTKYFKIIPIDNFLKEQGECELMIGFNADEEPGEDRTGNFMKCMNVKYTYPLFEDGLTREDCETVLNTHGLHPNFPIYMQRGGCWMCIFKSIPEYKALYYFDKETFEKARKLEKDIQDRKKKFFTISMTQQSMNDIANECERELELWGWESVKEMYSKIKPSQACGAFCHR